MKRLPLWMGLAGAGWMVVAIGLFALRAIALRTIVVTNYVGFRTGRMFPLVGREPSIWDVWILNVWMVFTGGAEFALVGLLLRFAIRRFAHSSEQASTHWQG